MQWFLLTFGRMLNGFLDFMHEGENRTARSKRCANWNERFSQIIRRVVLLTLNTFLKCCAKSLAVYGFKIDFSKFGSSSRLPGLFNENGIYNMLEASGIDFIHHESPFWVDLMIASAASPELARLVQLSPSTWAWWPFQWSIKSVLYAAMHQANFSTRKFKLSKNMQEQLLESIRHCRSNRKRGIN